MCVHVLSGHSRQWISVPPLTTRHVKPVLVAAFLHFCVFPLFSISTGAYWAGQIQILNVLFTFHSCSVLLLLFFFFQRSLFMKLSLNAARVLVWFSLQLVTRQPQLARRFASAALGRFGVRVSDVAGRPLAFRAKRAGCKCHHDDVTSSRSECSTAKENNSTPLLCTALVSSLTPSSQKQFATSNRYL